MFIFCWGVEEVAKDAEDCWWWAWIDDHQPCRKRWRALARMLIGSRDEYTYAGNPQDGHDRRHSNSPTRPATHTSVWRWLWPGKCHELYGLVDHVASMYVMQKVYLSTQPATRQRVEWQKVFEWTKRQALWLSLHAQSRRCSVLVTSTHVCFLAQRTQFPLISLDLETSYCWCCYEYRQVFSVVRIEQLAAVA